MGGPKYRHAKYDILYEDSQKRDPALLDTRISDVGTAAQFPQASDVCLHANVVPCAAGLWALLQSRSGRLAILFHKDSVLYSTLSKIIVCYSRLE